MVIYGTEQVSPEVIKINSSAGLAFFIRTIYLKSVQAEHIVINAEFTDEDEKDIIDAGMCYAAEAKATEYLARAEQCRFKLTQKLSAKKYEKQYIDAALDYLESKDYLNDRRFALFWLNDRKLNHAEGRTKLNAELLSRGIKKDDARAALDDFFAANDEQELCCRALQKCLRTKKESDKIVRTLLSLGFSYKIIKNAMDSVSQED